MKKTSVFLSLFSFFSLIFGQNYNTPLKALQAEAMINAGLTGKGVKIGIIDAGFHNADKATSLKAIFEEGRVKQAHDFVNDTIGNFYANNSQSHGKSVWEYIGGYDPATNTYTGMAKDATFYLARTEYNDSDYLQEEKFMESALEEMYQKGIRLVNISLGYTTKHKNPAEDYTPSQMNGKTTYCTNVCQKYAEKGMIIVIAAGNEGNEKNWKIISAPADAKDVISVGGVGSTSKISSIKAIVNGGNPNDFTKAWYSSEGPIFLEYLKPDISAHSEMGTSFAAPIITGLVAAMLQKDSTLSPLRVKELLQKSATLAMCPNNYIGYGIPNAKNILQVMENPFNEPNTSVKEINVKLSRYIVNTSQPKVTIFYKSSPAVVAYQKEVKPSGDKVKIKKQKGIVRTTVISGKDIYELKW